MAVCFGVVAIDLVLQVDDVKIELRGVIILQDGNQLRGLMDVERAKIGSIVVSRGRGLEVAWSQ
eukprot:5301153-Pyramimonas_sp.AAC.1